MLRILHYVIFVGEPILVLHSSSLYEHTHYGRSDSAKVVTVPAPVSTSHFGPWYPADSRVLSHSRSPCPADSRGLFPFSFWHPLRTRMDSVISASGTPGTCKDSVISASGTPRASEYSVISALGTLGTRYILQNDSDSQGNDLSPDNWYWYSDGLLQKKIKGDNKVHKKKVVFFSFDPSPRYSRGLSHFSFWYPCDPRVLSYISSWYPGDSQRLSHFNFWYPGDSREDSVISESGTLGTRQVSITSTFSTLGLARTQLFQLLLPWGLGTST